MGYLGNRPAESYASFERQVFTIVNSQTAYTLNHAVTNENDIRLVVNNVVQEPGSGKAYTASGTTLTLSAALVNGTDEMYCVFLGRALQTINPPNASVGSAQVADTLISGQTALASEPADTDEFLVSDAGTLKRIDYSLIKGGGITEADMWRLSASITGISSSTTTVLGSNWERVDDATFSYIGSGMSESSGIFTFPSTGIYQIILSIGAYTNGQAAEEYFKTEILGTSNNSSYSDLTQSSQQIADITTYDYARGYSSTYFDVTNTSTHKVKFAVFFGSRTGNIGGKSTETITGVQFIRLGDT
jgi:hypothetical protein